MALLVRLHPNREHPMMRIAKMVNPVYLMAGTKMVGKDRATRYETREAAEADAREVNRTQNVMVAMVEEE